MEQPRGTAANVRVKLSTEKVQDVPRALERYREAVLAQLQSALRPNGLGLYHLLHYHMGWMDAQGHPIRPSGGKALRPALCLLACEMVGGDGPEALPAAAALELVHNFSLIHDDIQDGDPERRHRPTVWYVWGQANALQAGNALRCIADRALLAPTERGIAPQVALMLSETLTARYLEMIEGQYLDLAFEGDLDVGMQQYLDMVSRKTGALIDCALFMGAFVATRDHRVAQAFGRCGRLLGLAFQIRDDLLAIWGNSDATGKATGADVRRRKKSFPAVYALEQSREVERAELRRIYSQDALTDQDVQRVLEIMDGLGTYTYGQALAEAKGAEALQTLGQLSIEPWARDELQAVASYFIHRER